MKYILFIFVSSLGFSQVQVRREMNIMHSPSSMTIVAKDSTTANAMIDFAVQELYAIECKISEWKTDSEISKINQNAGIMPIKVSQEIFDMVYRAQKIAEITDGAFDLSWASVDKIWKFDGSMRRLPTDEEVKKSIQFVNYKNIVLDETNRTIFLKEKGMKIGTGGNGQGYGADVVKKKLQEMSITDALLNISGDINAWGKQVNGDPWKVGVVNPLNKEKIIAWFDLSDQSFTTSGNYEKYVTFDGKKYSHIIDPRTGYPAHGVASVSIFAYSTELADILDTAIMVLGVEVGMNLINQIPNVSCIIIDEDNKIHYSENLKINQHEVHKPIDD